jgi:hypothetical protein
VEDGVLASRMLMRGVCHQDLHERREMISRILTAELTFSIHQSGLCNT